MAENMSGKTILITGAGGGFGRLTATKCAARGAAVACLDINEDAAKETARLIGEAGGKAFAMRADVTAIADMQAAVEAIIAQFGAIDVLVNNAGTMPLAFLADHATALESWNRCIDINFKGVMNGTVAVYDHMKARGKGHIVNLSSIYGNAPVVGAAVYGATKAAIDYFSHSVRQESRGVIKVTVIKPTGVMDTGLGQSVVNQAASAGILGLNAGDFMTFIDRALSGKSEPGELDAEDIRYAALSSEYIAEAIVHAIDQPWGVSISDMTIRASGDHYTL